MAEEIEPTEQPKSLEPAEYVHHFLKPTRDFFEEEQLFLDINTLVQTNQVDYIAVRSFLFTAINNILEIDVTIQDGFFSKIKKDVQNLYKTYSTFVSKNKIPKVVFENNFLNQYRPYKEKKSILDNALRDKAQHESAFKKYQIKIDELESKQKLTLEEKKNLSTFRGKNADAIHHYAEARDKLDGLIKEVETFKEQLEVKFIPLFEEEYKNIIVLIKKVLNTKSFYLDKALWHFSEESPEVKSFFINSNIKGEFSLKTYVAYQEKSIDAEKSLDKEKHAKIREVLLTLD